MKKKVVLAIIFVFPFLLLYLVGFGINKYRNESEQWELQNPKVPVSRGSAEMLAQSIVDEQYPEFRDARQSITLAHIDGRECWQVSFSKRLLVTRGKERIGSIHLVTVVINLQTGRVMIYESN